MTDPGAISAAIIGYRYRYANEGELQEIVAQVLDRAGVLHEREVALSPSDRIDFLAGTVGIEVKLSGSRGTVIGQLFRYAASERIWSLILVTSRRQLTAMPSSISGKALITASIGGSFA